MTPAADRPGDDSLAVPEPATGRVYRHRRRVQLADASPKGRMRLDAMARFFQDVSDEDTSEIGLDPAAPWVVRRVVLRVDAFPVFREQADVSTWCSGVGGRWAERRVSIDSATGRVEAAVLWIHLDPAMRPAKLPALFDEVYTPVAAGRTVRARLHHDRPPADAPVSPFALRFTDADLMDHVNNAVAWVPIEEELAGRPELRAPLRVSVEHPAPLDSFAAANVQVADVDGGFDLWLRDGDTVCASAQVRPA